MCLRAALNEFRGQKKVKMYLLPDDIMRCDAQQNKSERDLHLFGTGVGQPTHTHTHTKTSAYAKIMTWPVTR